MKSNAIRLAATSIFVLCLANPAASQSSHSFSDFPPEATLTGDARTPDFSGRDADHRNFRTRILEGVATGVNYAGRYSLIEIGCGTSCRFAKVVDLQTGEVGAFPYGGEEYYQMKLTYSPDSQLLKARWQSGYGDCIEQDMVIDGLDWQVLDERSVAAVNGYCDY